MIYTPLTKKAALTAYHAHLGQFDKGGMPYIFHPYHLAETMPDEITAAVALLHDVVEDTGITFEKLCQEGFPEEVLIPLKLLTRQPNEDYFEYIDRIKDNTAARHVKIADLRHNSDMSRLDSSDEKAVRRLEKYKKALKILTEAEQR